MKNQLLAILAGEKEAYRVWKAGTASCGTLSKHAKTVRKAKVYLGLNLAREVKGKGRTCIST